VRRKRRPGGVSDERARLIWDAWHHLELLDYRRRSCGGVLTGRWQAIEQAIVEALDPDDLDALRRIAAGEVQHGSSQASVVALAGPEPGPDDPAPDGYRSIALRAGWGGTAADGDGGEVVVPLRRETWT
jgi:hypothetical protein